MKVWTIDTTENLFSRTDLSGSIEEDTDALNWTVPTGNCIAYVKLCKNELRNQCV